MQREGEARRSFVIAKRREKKEKPCQEVDVMSPGNDYVGWRASLTTPEGQ